MSLKTMPEHVRHRLTMHITNVFCLWITNQPDITWCNCYSALLFVAKKKKKKKCHISAYLLALWPRRPSVLLIHGCLHMPSDNGSYLRSSWHCSFWCSAFGKKNNLIPTFLPRTRSVSFPHTVTFTQWVPLPHRCYDRDPVLRQLLQLTDQLLHRWARPRVPVEVISEDERTLHDQLQPHQVPQLVEAQQVFLWFPAEKSAGNRTGLVNVPQEQVHNIL